MPANTSPIFTLTPNTSTVALAAANTASDGSGVITTLFTAGANGSRVERVTFINSQLAAAVSTANVGKVFISHDAGVTWFLYAEIAIPAVTRSTSAIGARQQIVFSNGLILETGHLLGATIAVYAGVQDRTNVNAEGGDY